MLVEIMKVFTKYMANEYYITIIIAKFNKYFDLLPHLLGLTIVVDPRCKDIGLQEFSELIFADEEQFVPIMQTYKKLFKKYKEAVLANRPVHTTAVLSRCRRLKCFLSNKN
mgnify:CR=1 FL=1